MRIERAGEYGFTFYRESMLYDIARGEIIDPTDKGMYQIQNDISEKANWSAHDAA